MKRVERCNSKREDGIGDDLKRILDAAGGLASCFVNAVDDIDGDLKAGSGLRVFDQLLDQRQGCEDNAFTGTGNVRKDAMLDRVVL